MVEDYKNKPNHELLVEIQKAQKEHALIKQKMLTSIDEYMELEVNLLSIEDRYKELVKTLKDRM